MSRFRRAVVILVAGAVLASACGGSGPTSAPVAADETLDGATTSRAIPATGPIVDESLKLAERLVERLDGVDQATDVLLIGAELGYSRSQLLDGVESGTLQADGTILDVDPAGQPLGRIDVGTRSAQVATSGKITKRPVAQSWNAGGIKGFIRFQDGGGEKIALEQLRDAAASSGAFRFEQQQVLGLHGVNLILVMLRIGLTPEQVIDGLILGVYFYEERGVCYSQALSVGKKEAEVRECDGATGDPQPAAPENDESAASAAPAAEPVVGAQYVGNLDGVLVDDPASTITVTISPEGTVSGQLMATEQLDNYIAAIGLCGIMGEDPDECGDQIDECPATVLWSSDLSTLQFAGKPPDIGTVSGVITIVWDTTPHGCGEPSTETTSVDIEATVSPDGALITIPLEIELERVQPQS